MRKLILVFMSVLLISALASAQTSPETFKGAEPSPSTNYKVLFILNQGDDKKIKGVIRNVNNAMNDPRFGGKLQVELLAFSDGVELYKKENKYDSLLLDLQKKGVLLAQCENTLKERKISKDALVSFISFVPSGVGEVIIRQQQGWSSVHP